MNLSQCRVEPTIAVSDMDAARAFYEGKLGLSNGEQQSDGGHTYPCAEGTRIHIYPSPDNAGRSGATLAGWLVDDVEGTVEELIAKGIAFEQYGAPFNTDERGIAKLGGITAAWFKDPDGNTLAIANG